MIMDADGTVWNKSAKHFQWKLRHFSFKNYSGLDCPSPFFEEKGESENCSEASSSLIVLVNLKIRIFKTGKKIVKLQWQWD